MNRQVFLLCMVGCLALLRFVVMPLSANNQATLERIENKQTRLDKGKAILATQAVLTQNLVAVKNQLSELDGTFPIMSSIEKGQLDIQRRINSLAKENNIIVDSVQWVATSTGSPVSTELEIQFDGKLNDMIKWHLDIEEIGTWISAEHVDFRVSKQRLNVKQQGQAKGVLVVKVVFVVQETTDEF